MKYFHAVPDYGCLPIAEQERAAYLAGDHSRAGILAMVADAEAAQSQAERELEAALDDARSLRRVLTMTIEAAERFAYDSEMDGDAIKVLANVLDNAKDSA